MIKLYGIANCQSVRKARAYFEQHGVAYTWIDWKKTPPTVVEITAWYAKLGDLLLNRRGMTWRQLDDATRQLADQPTAVVTLIVQQPMLMKRPLIEWQDGSVTVGFDVELFNGKLDIEDEF